MRKWVMRGIVVSALIAGLGSAAPCLPATYTVSNRGGADYTTLQAAINAASPGDTVIVEDGVYHGSGNINISFSGKAITVRSRNGAVNCVIDCDQAGRGCIFRSGEGASSVLDGFTIQNGYGTYLYDFGSFIRPGGHLLLLCEDNGGGICCTGSSPTIRNCVLLENEAENNGGGIYCDRSSPTIEGCTLVRNSCHFLGAGMACENGSSPVVRRCTISTNVAPDPDTGGGGIFLRSGMGQILDSTITRNVAGDGGGILVTDGGPTISGCTISENRARDGGLTGNGGGICCEGNEDTEPELYIRNCFISGNLGDLFGGGIMAEGSNPVVEGCTISSNSSYMGGGIGCGQDSSPLIVSCLIAKNTAQCGGGVASMGGGVLGSAPGIERCVIRDNVANGPSDAYPGDAGVGGGIYLRGSVAAVKSSVILKNTATVRGGGIYCELNPGVTSGSVVNCTVRRNRAAVEGSGVYCVNAGIGTLALANTIVWENTGTGTAGPYQVFADTGARVALTSCALQGGGSAAVGRAAGAAASLTSILSANPLFGDDWHLKPLSPCVNGGGGAFAAAAGDRDIDSQPRVMQGRIDIGADEIPSGFLL